MERLKWLAVVAGLSMAWACSNGTTPGNNTATDLGPDYTPKTGLLHGEACRSNDECKYGVCYDSPNITGSQFKICTKDCTSSDHNALCNIDDTDTIHYTCLRWGTYHPEETITGFCVPTCQTVDDCKAIDSRYNTCKMPGTGTYKVCMYKK